MKFQMQANTIVMKITHLSCLPFLLLISNFIPLTSSKSFFNLTTDESALIAFKNSITTSNPNSVLLENWSIDRLICGWIGVSCGSKHRRVTTLKLSGYGLRGSIVPHLGNLTFLRFLDISSNNFTGALPSELSKLRHLEYIDVGANNFTGEIPSWFGALSELRHVYLSNNGFSGSFPTSLFNISKLETLSMGYNSFGGNIPEEIGNLSYLKIIRLEGNEFMGFIPNSIFNISSLLAVNLGRNMLSGKIPDNICSNTPKLRNFTVYWNEIHGEISRNIVKCRDLKLLQLQANNFSGNIPSEIGSLSMLEALYLWSNQFKGGIPKQLGNLTSLRVLNLETNYLTGEIPEELGKLSFLVGLLAMENFLSGSLPSSIFNISTLYILRLSANNFSGNLPSNNGLSLPNLGELHLRDNNFTGLIPSCITNASSLLTLELSNNSFSGSIAVFRNLRSLQNLYITSTLFSGSRSSTQELEFITSLTNCQYLEDLQISNNPLNGVLPSSIGNLSRFLHTFWANGCNIKGGLPSTLGNLSSLRNLYISRNQLSGSIPATIGKLRRMQIMQLYKNKLHGFLPVELCEMVNLGDLYLFDNVLTGPIPECFGELKSLRNMDLSSNKLNSEIPSTMWNLRDIVTLNLSFNYLSGEISSLISQLKVVNGIYLSSNQFSGGIPDMIDKCESVEILDFSNNVFGGSIPQTLGNIKGLTNIDLSNNNLSGLIPKSLEELKFLEHFNVSYNRLEGEIPNGGCFGNFTPQSFAYNAALCGATRFQVPPCVRNHGRSRWKSVAQFMKYIVPSFIVATILAIIVVTMIRRRKHARIPPPADDASLGIAWRMISYNELMMATNSFSETNLLGRGSFGLVFKGEFSDGIGFAVKVFNLELEGGNKSFETESRILSTIRHRNLVRIIGCCTNVEFKALILEFMPNGSLEKWLYSDIYGLDILQLLNIAIDVGLALEYLHHGNTFPIVHCDIKPSNVLLDEDMTARVADFGIAKLFEEGETMIQTSTLATIGYAAPEYGSEGIVSTSADVYSFGIMLLEMFTRKRPTDDMFDGAMSLKDWVSEALQANAINQVLDPSLLSEGDRHFVAKEECVASVFDLAMKCLAISPNERINMTEAAAILKKIKAKAVRGITTRRQRHAITVS